MEFPEPQRVLAGVGYLIVIALIARVGAVSAAGSFLPNAPARASSMALNDRPSATGFAPTLYRMASLP